MASIIKLFYLPGSLVQALGRSPWAS